MFRVTSRLFLTISLLAAPILTACNHTFIQGDFRTIHGSGTTIEESRNVGRFSSVSLATMGDLSIGVGNTESLRIIADDNLMEQIETEVHNGELRINTTKHINLRPTRSIRYYLTVKDLNKISLYSSGNIQAPNLKAEDFYISIASSGDLKIEELEAETLRVDIFSSGNVNIGELIADKINVNISSSGDLEITAGKVRTQDIALNSSGKYSAPNLSSSEARANLNSSGSATIRVSNHLTANLNSSGHLRYHGNPAVEINRNSSGDATKLD